MGVYAQHAKYFNSIECNICPREAFLIDLKMDIIKFQEAGHHLILMIDGNEDMRRGHLAKTLSSLQLKEAILKKHGTKAPSTYKRNTRDIPIDGIWVSLTLNIIAGGYFAMDEVIPRTDHRSLWIDLSFKAIFGHDHNIITTKPAARHLTNRNPQIRDNFNQCRRKLASNSLLIERIICLESYIEAEMSPALIQEYETLDKIRRQHVLIAGKNAENYAKATYRFQMFCRMLGIKLKAYPCFLNTKKGNK
jgi:hypothetical protein